MALKAESILLVVLMKTATGFKLVTGFSLLGCWCDDGGDLKGGRLICGVINETL